MKLKSKYLVFLIVICILFSLTAVSAADNQTDVLNGNGNALSEKQTATTIKTYDDLYADMKNSTGIFDMQYDYKYSVNDSVSFLEINVSSLVINGNGHVIDGSNEVAGLYFLNMDNEITLNDLTFINCNEFAMASAGNVTLNNVNFTGNFIGSSIS